MTLTVNVKKDFPLQEVSSVIRSALALDGRIAKHKKAKYSEACKIFEKKYGWRYCYRNEKGFAWENRVKSL